MPVKVVLDTNILVSALVYPGKPRLVLELVITKQIQGFISASILTELAEVLIKKFKFEPAKYHLIEKEVKNNFTVVSPTEIIHVLPHYPDNRVLEAASVGSCHFIITGDKHFLDLGFYKKIKILTATQFLEELDKVH